MAPSLSRRSTPSPQPPYQSQVSRSATPTDASNFALTAHRLPSYYPHRQKPLLTANSNNSSFESLPPRTDRIYERQSFTPKPRPYQSTSTLKLSTPNISESSKNDNSPSVSFLRRTQTQTDVLDEDNKKHKNRDSSQFSPPLSRRDSEPAIVLENEANETETNLPPRPNSRLSAKARAKSPSLTSLRQGKFIFIKYFFILFKKLFLLNFKNFNFCIN